VHQQGRIEAPERLIAELLLKNEKLRMAAISTAHEEDPSNNSGVILTNAPTASRLCNQAGTNNAESIKRYPDSRRPK
jgi:hypothetical protein